MSHQAPYSWHMLPLHSKGYGQNKLNHTDPFSDQHNGHGGTGELAAQF